MTRFSLVAALFLICTFISFAQDTTAVDEDTTFASFEFTPPKPSKWGGAIGYTAALLYPDYAPINKVLADANAGQLASGPIVVTGPQIYAYVTIIPNLRLGGQWGSGSKSTNSLVGNIRRDVEMGAHYGGINLDYVVPVTSRLDLSVGTLIGWGGMDLTIRRDSGGAKDWGNIWGEYGSTARTGEYTRKMSASFFTYYPSVNLEFAVLRWLGIRGGVGYQGSFGGSWKLDDTYDLYNVPGDITSKGMTVNLGIFLGYFVY